MICSHFFVLKLLQDRTGRSFLPLNLWSLDCETVHSNKFLDSSSSVLLGGPYERGGNVTITDGRVGFSMKESSLKEYGGLFQSEWRIYKRILIKRNKISSEISLDVTIHTDNLIIVILGDLILLHGQKK